MLCHWYRDFGSPSYSRRATCILRLLRRDCDCDGKKSTSSRSRHRGESTSRIPVTFVYDNLKIHSDQEPKIRIDIYIASSSFSSTTTSSLPAVLYFLDVGNVAFGLHKPCPGFLSGVHLVLERHCVPCSTTVLLVLSYFFSSLTLFHTPHSLSSSLFFCLTFLFSSFFLTELSSPHLRPASLRISLHKSSARMSSLEIVSLLPGLARI